MHPWLQAMQGLISLSRPSRALFGHSGSARSERPMATKSALPSRMSPSPISGERSFPTAITGMPTASFTPCA